MKTIPFQNLIFFILTIFSSLEILPEILDFVIFDSEDVIIFSTYTVNCYNKFRHPRTLISKKIFLKSPILKETTFSNNTYPKKKNKNIPEGKKRANWVKSQNRVTHNQMKKTCQLIEPLIYRLTKINQPAR